MNRGCLLLACGLAVFARAADRVTFTEHVAPILYAHCASCHRPGEAAPFSLLTYNDARSHATQIAAVTRSRFMPLWLADPGPVPFEGENRLTAAQIRTLGVWVDAGEPEGPPHALPPAPRFAEGWQLGPPDLILSVPKPYTMPASGPDVYRNFILPITVDRVRYVRALEIRPGNRKAVHHANALVDRKRVSRSRDGIDGQPGFPGMDLQIETDPLDPDSHFLFWKPGLAAQPEPPGMSWAIEPGTDLVLNMHMQPSGKPEEVAPSVGLYLTNEKPVRKPILVQLEQDRALDIPPGAKAFAVTDSFTLPVDAELMAVYPHAHYLGKDCEGLAELPDGRKQTLIRIRNWDPNWQAVFRYTKPLALPKGTRLSMRWLYDNTDANPRNPNSPPARVTAGNRATDEMGHLWLQLLPSGGDAGRLAVQRAMLESRVAREPDNFTALFNLSGVLAAEGDRAGAVAKLRDALRSQPEDAVAHNTLGAYLYQSGERAAAEAEFRRALTLADARYNLASLLLDQGIAEEAIGLLRGLPNVEAKLSAALQLRAQARVQVQDLAGAARDFQEAAELTPNDADAWTNCGVARARLGQLPEAKDAFERALRAEPAHAAARANLARVDALLHQR